MTDKLTEKKTADGKTGIAINGTTDEMTYGKTDETTDRTTELMWQKIDGKVDGGTG